ncbi:MAG: hypothetical protein AMXMBFR22_05740 [Phycisphaerae bacterium]
MVPIPASFIGASSEPVSVVRPHGAFRSGQVIGDPRSAPDLPDPAMPDRKGMSEKRRVTAIRCWAG